MTRVAVVALMMSIAAGPEACSKITGGGQATADTPPPPPPPTPVTSATTPPVWTPPDTTPDETSSSAAPAKDPDFVKAKEAAAKGDHKKVRALLDKKVKSGKATNEEVELLLEACTALKDKACIDVAKSKQ